MIRALPIYKNLEEASQRDAPEVRKLAKLQRVSGGSPPRLFSVGQGTLRLVPRYKYCL